ncbi:EAL domain-containing protein [Treponema sp. UBA3813]|uniref:two-component system response regulator n=1 Tax=Treponema sp. UBA3813 TaxID=1947715 RepID=UPI0025D6F67D|nr:EAL domain-containing protein [Treponema sp. UBA3813]
MIRRDTEFKRTVLVVDDEDVNRALLGAIIEQKYNVLYAKNGKEALDQIKQNADGLSLVLLDILMPEMDGYEVLGEINKDSKLKKIPVVVLTSEKSAEVKSLELGAADFLSKPYDLPEVILARVQHSIQLFEGNKIIQATENDALTNLYTPEFFFEYGHQYDKRHPSHEMDSIVIDFSRFHLLNELHGRETGDEVLIKIADGIREIFNEIFGIACRHDADTFYLYTKHRAEYTSVIEKITVKLISILKSQEIRIRMGVYFDKAHEIPFESRFDRALQACNGLRNKHGSAVAIYDEEMHQKEMFAARLLEDFDTAIREKQFRVYFQPKYNITGDTPLLSSSEALIRWIHPELGFIRPDLFIPLFEENGLVQKLDRYVWKEAAEQIKKWRDKYGITKPVSVNVSRVDISDPDMTDYICKIVNENEISSHDYLLEITESAYTDNSQQIIDIVNNLRNKGFRIEMDDFGSGYSSLNMLTTLPIDALKLDKGFINNIAHGNKEMRMVELILEIAEFLKVPVIAEGVETREQLELLKIAKCDVIQGYYFSKPLPPEEFNALIEKDIEVRKELKAKEKEKEQKQR